jgi:hypothetical protein
MPCRHAATQGPPGASESHREFPLKQEFRGPRNPAIGVIPFGRKKSALYACFSFVIMKSQGLVRRAGRRVGHGTGARDADGGEREGRSRGPWAAQTGRPAVGGHSRARGASVGCHTSRDLGRRIVDNESAGYVASGHAQTYAGRPTGWGARTDARACRSPAGDLERRRRPWSATCRRRARRDARGNATEPAGRAARPHR